jgi:hypothetical protein
MDCQEATYTRDETRKVVDLVGSSDKTPRWGLELLPVGGFWKLRPTLVKNKQLLSTRQLLYCLRYFHLRHHIVQFNHVACKEREKETKT